MEGDLFPAIKTNFRKTYLDNDELRDIQTGEVLVQVESAPINPNDQLFTMGYYSDQESRPYGVGFEGSGIIVKVAIDVDENLLHQKVAFLQQPSMPDYDGTWRKYIYLKAEGLVTYPSELDCDSIATISMNPPTVCGFIDITQKQKAKSVIHDAASSALGKMFTRICKIYEIPLINIVRRQEQVDILKDQGAEIILNSSDENFEHDLKEVIETHQPTVYFDAIGGSFPSKVLSLMPKFSTMYVYGNLSGESIHYDATNLIFKCHNISHFFIMSWIQNLTAEEKSHWFGMIVDDIKEGGEVFGSKIAKKFPIEEFEAAMRYANDHGSEGKVILNP